MFETKSSYCRAARQALPCYTALARLGFKRRATAMLKSNLIQSIEFGTAVVLLLLVLTVVIGVSMSLYKKIPANLY